MPLLLALTACQASRGDPGATLGRAASGPPTATTERSPAPVPTADVADVPAGVILFHRLGADGVERYFTIQTDGTDAHALFTAQGCGCAQWSADWTKILSIGPTGQGTWSLLTMAPDGRDEVVVTPPIEGLSLFVGASSADGRVIAFNGMHEADPSRSGLYVASPELSDARLVTPLLEGWIAAEPYGLTPDGSKIVFFVETGREGGTTHAGDLYVIDAHGSGLRLLNPPGHKVGFFEPLPVVSVSPDGRHAAFGLDDAVFVVDLDGGEARPITRRAGFVWAVSWSPTGEWISYTRLAGTTPVITLVRPDGTDQRDISDAVDEANAGVWSPDGRYLLVRRGNDGRSDLWIMDLDGQLIGRVTDHPSTYGAYSWAPPAGS